MKSILNYVWIGNKDYYNPNHFASGSPIPAEYLNNVIKIAYGHADVPTWVWCDYEALGKKNVAFLKDLEGPSASLCFKDLNEIELYRNTSLFSFPKKIIPKVVTTLFSQLYKDVLKRQTWQQVDLARWVVLDHVLRTTQVDAVFYSDLDIVNPDIKSKHAKKSMRDFGFLFGYWNHNGTSERCYVENGFLGVHQKQRHVLCEALIPDTLDAYEMFNHDGYTAFRLCMRDVCKKEKAEAIKYSFVMRSLGQGKARCVFDKKASVQRRIFYVIGAKKNRPLA